MLILKNGDHITGEIKKLQRGTLEFKTERMGTLNVEWPAVARLTSSIDFEVVLDDGRKFYGTLAPDGSSLNFPVKSPYGSPRSVKLLIPSTCLAGEARCEAPRLS